jgi:hypothetical protein
MKILIKDFDQLMLNGLPVFMELIESISVDRDPISLYNGHCDNVRPAEENPYKPFSLPQWLFVNLYLGSSDRDRPIKIYSLPTTRLTPLSAPFSLNFWAQLNCGQTNEAI